MASSYIDPAKLDLDDQVVSINRITKVVKGRSSFRFAALVVVGDHNGHASASVLKPKKFREAIRRLLQPLKRI